MALRASDPEDRDAPSASGRPTAVSRCWTIASTSARSTRTSSRSTPCRAPCAGTSQVADNALGYAITSAPLAIDGKIIIGVSGGEAGVRGFLDAYDAEDRQRVWRFHTVPGPGETGHDTWGGDSWKTGGAPTWLTGCLRSGAEPALLGRRQPRARLERRHPPGRQPVQLLAAWRSTRRPARCAGTSSSRRTTRTTGTPTRFRCSSTPTVDGRPRKLVVTANRNGFYYVLDRADRRVPAGHRLRQADVGAAGSTRAAGPIVIPGTEPSEKGTLVWPSLQGATNWFSPAFDARRQLLFVPVREMGSTLLQGRGRVRARQAVHGRRRSRGGRRARRTAPCARSMS